MANLKVGQTMRFDPFREIRGYGTEAIRAEMTGPVVFVHPTNRWFMCEYESGGLKRKVSYSFNDFYGEQKKVWRVKE